MGLQEDILHVRSRFGSTIDAEALGRQAGAHRAASTRTLRHRAPSRLAAFIKGYKNGERQRVGRSERSGSRTWPRFMSVLPRLLWLWQWLRFFSLPLHLVLSIWHPLRFVASFARPRLPRFRRASVFAVSALAALVGGGFLIEPLLTPSMSAQAKQDPIVLAADLDLNCQPAAMMTDRSGRELGLFRFNFDPACHGRPMTAPLPLPVRSMVTRGIIHAEGAADGLFTIFGNHVLDTVHAALFNWELERQGLSRRAAMDKLKLGTLDTILPWSGTSTWPTFLEARAVAGLPAEALSSKQKNILASARADALWIKGDKSERARLLSEYQPVVRVRNTTGAGAVELGGQLGWNYLFDDGADLLGASCLFQAGWGRYWLAHPGPPAGAAAIAARARFDRNVGMARVCVRALAANNSERDAALAYIAAWRLPNKPLPSLSTHELILFTDAAPMLPQAAVSAGALETTLDSKIQDAGALAVAEVLKEIAPSLPAGLCFDSECETQVHFQLSLTETFADTGTLEQLGFWTNKHHLGLGALFIDTEDQIAGHEPAFGLASLHKILVAIDAIRINKMALCNRKIADVTNSNRYAPPPVDTCRSDAVGWIPLDVSFGRSDNLGFLDHAIERAIQIAFLEDLFGFVGPRGAPAQAALGTSKKAPLERFMTIVSATFRGVRGEEPRASLKIFRADSGRFLVNLAPLELAHADFSKIATVFAAPLTHRHGTLRGLHNALEGTACITALGGKSGSPVTPAQLAFARAAVIQLECASSNETPRHFTVGVLIAASDQTVPIQIGYSEVHRLVGAAFASFAPLASSSPKLQD